MLIDKQAVLNALEKEREFLILRGQLGAENVLVHHAINIIDDLAIKEIVQCKDCKYGHKDENYKEWVFCTKPYTAHGTANHSPDWYCADGVKYE